MQSLKDAFRARLNVQFQMLDRRLNTSFKSFLMSFHYQYYVFFIYLLCYFLFRCSIITFTRCNKLAFWVMSLLLTLDLLWYFAAELPYNQFLILPFHDDIALFKVGYIHILWKVCLFHLQLQTFNNLLLFCFSYYFNDISPW